MLKNGNQLRRQRKKNEVYLYVNKVKQNTSLKLKLSLYRGINKLEVVLKNYHVKKIIYLLNITKTCTEIYYFIINKFYAKSSTFLAHLVDCVFDLVS